MFEELESVTRLDQVSPHSRDKLEAFIGDYNSLFNTKFTTKDSQSFHNYYNDIVRRAKNKELDLLLVVNMFLTGKGGRISTGPERPSGSSLVVHISVSDSVEETAWRRVPVV